MPAGAERLVWPELRAFRPDLHCQLVVLRAEAALRVFCILPSFAAGVAGGSVLFLLVASFCRRSTPCFSAHASHRVWFGIACLRQSLQIPSSLALSRRSLAALLEVSLWSGSDCLWASRPSCSSGVLSTFGGETFFSGLGFGSDLGLVFPGFVNRRRSPGFSRVGVDEGMSAGSYLPLNLAGSGTRSRKVKPTAIPGPGAASTTLVSAFTRRTVPRRRRACTDKQGARGGPAQCRGHGPPRR